MTNYNKRLDEILDSLEIESDMSADDSGNYWIEGESEAKQAITSLIKELVAEAKPNREDKAYTNPIYNSAIYEFEQNLLKVLGYEDEK